MNKEEVIKEIESKYKSINLFKRIFSWKYVIDLIIKSISNINNIDESTDQNFGDENLLELNNEIEKLKGMLEEKDNSLNEKEKTIKEKDNAITNITSNKDLLENQLNTLMENIATKTNDLHKIFKNSSGNKGKISEAKIENVLNNYFGKSGEFWEKNLPVGSGRVEFAIKDFNINKWTPVDSKSIIPEISDDEFIIDSSYVTKIKKASNDINSKYISKKNTTPYALLVLPSDELVAKLFEFDPGLFFTMSKEKNIFITSPTTFTQVIDTIKNLSKNMEKINQSKKILDSINLIKKHMETFYKNSRDGLEKINKAFDKDMKNINNNLQKLEDQVEPSKTKLIDSLDNDD